jgi:hypothetical protein
MEPTPQPSERASQLVVGLLSILIMLGGVFLMFRDDLAVGAALLAIGAAITPSVAWWRRPRNGA